MNPAAISLWAALLIQIGLGVAVFRANSKNHANQSFFVVSFFISAWLLSLHFAYNAAEAGAAESWIRNAWATGVLVVNGFNLLRLGILCRNSGWKQIGARAANIGVPSLVAIALCYTTSFLRYAEIRGGSATPDIPLPVYGPLFPLFA